MTKKITLILLSILFLGSCKQKEESPAGITTIQGNGEKTQDKDSQKMTEESVMKLNEENYDFKDIKKGESVTHVFSFINTGKKPLIISEVRPSCGCTTPKYTKDPVYPGQKGFITVTFDSSNFDQGMIYKTVTVSGNFKTQIIKFQAKIN